MENLNRINEILNSSNNIMKVVPNDDLFEIIKDKINNQKEIMPVKWLFAIAATLLLLMLLNIEVIRSKIYNSNTKKQIIAESISKSNELY